MIKVQIQIEDGPIYDSANTYGLVYLSSDSRFSPPLRDFESTTYAEQSGKNVLPLTVFESFDYTVKFFVDASLGIEDANQKIYDFNKILYSEGDGDTKAFKRVTFYNDYKKVKIVGYPKLIETADTFWRDSRGRVTDVVCVPWVITVDKPEECDFNYKNV